MAQAPLLGAVELPVDLATPRTWLEFLRSPARCSSTVRGLSLLLAMVVLPTPKALARDEWIEIEPFRAAGPAPAKVYLLVGENLEGEAVRPRNRSHYSRFALYSTAGARDAFEELQEDEQPIAALNLRARGTYMVVLDSEPRDVELAADKFQSYLQDEGLAAILAARAKTHTASAPGVERYSTYLKAILQRGSSWSDFVCTPTGQELEIVPSQNPYSLSAGKSLEVRVLFKGKPLPGRAIMAASRWRTKTEAITKATDERGRVAFVLDRPGDWIIRLVHMEKSTEATVDWRSYRSSMTFSVKN
jgi:hypothetical protein